MAKVYFLSAHGLPDTHSDYRVEVGNYATTIVAPDGSTAEVVRESDPRCGYPLGVGASLLLPSAMI